MSALPEVPRYEPRVACIPYCYGGSVVLDVDEWADATDPLAVVKLADHLAALRACEERVLTEAQAAVRVMTNTGGYPEHDFDHIKDDACDVIAAMERRQQ